MDDIPKEVNTYEKLKEYYLNCPFKNSDIDLFVWGNGDEVCFLFSTWEKIN